jgi:quercetin dioxygenase-like cupin family protein
MWAPYCIGFAMTVHQKKDIAMSKLQALNANSLTEALTSPGIIRHIAFKGEGFQIIRARSNPGVISGWHHHGDYDVFGYVVSGTGRFESDPSGGDAINVSPGDFFHVPPHTIHAINPSPNEEMSLSCFFRG